MGGWYSSSSSEGACALLLAAMLRCYQWFYLFGSAHRSSCTLHPPLPPLPPHTTHHCHHCHHHPAAKSCSSGFSQQSGEYRERPVVQRGFWGCTPGAPKHRRGRRGVRREGRGELTGQVGGEAGHAGLRSAMRANLNGSGVGLKHDAMLRGEGSSRLRCEGSGRLLWARAGFRAADHGLARSGSLWAPGERLLSCATPILQCAPMLEEAAHTPRTHTHHTHTHATHTHATHTQHTLAHRCLPEAIVVLEIDHVSPAVAIHRALHHIPCGLHCACIIVGRFCLSCRMPRNALHPHFPCPTCAGCWTCS